MLLTVGVVAGGALDEDDDDDEDKDTSVTLGRNSSEGNFEIGLEETEKISLNIDQQKESERRTKKK